MREPAAQELALRAVVLLGTLGLDHGVRGAVAQAELDELGPTGLGVLRRETFEPVDRTVVDGASAEERAWRINSAKLRETTP